MFHTSPGTGEPPGVRAAEVPRTIAAALAAAARERPGGIAIRSPGGTLSFAQLEAEVRAAASGLIALGVAPRDRVAVWAPNTLDAAIALLAVPLAGAIAVPVNTRYQAREVRDIVGQADCALMLAPASFLGRGYAAEAAELLGAERVVALEPVPPASEPVPPASAGDRSASEPDPPASAGDRSASQPDRPASAVALPPAVTSWSRLLAAGRAAGQSALADRIAAQAAARATAWATERAGDDIAVIQYTSGTTGRPKGAALRQAPMLASAAEWCRITGLAPGGAFPVAYPLSHVGGFKTGLLTSLVAHATAVLRPVIDAESVVAMIAESRPDVVSAAPPVLRWLLAAAASGRLSRDTRIRTVVAGSAIVPPALIRELAETFGTQDVIIGYGLTEATGVCTMTRRGDPLDRICDTIGRPVPGVEVRVAPAVGPVRPADAPDAPDRADAQDRADAVDGADAVDDTDAPDGTDGAHIGEIQVRGPNVMAGYWGDPGATAEVMDGEWLRTGDLGWIGPDGYVRIAGRAREMIIVGGFNVYPAEVEQVLNEHPDVAEAAVVGVPDDRLGEVAAAYVVPAPGARPDQAALIAWCRERLANFKVPRHVLALEALPRGAGGKVAKDELAHRARTELGRS